MVELKKCVWFNPTQVGGGGTEDTPRAQQNQIPNHGLLS